MIVANINNLKPFTGVNGDSSSAVMTRASKLALAEFDNLARINKAIKGHVVGDEGHHFSLREKFPWGVGSKNPK